MIDEEFILRELQAVGMDLNYGDPNKSAARKKKLYIQDLNPAQLKEYKELAKLNTRGKFKEFSEEMVKFKKKHKLGNYGGPNKSSGQLVMVRSLTPVQKKEYQQISKLNRDGKFSEFGRELVKFRRRHQLSSDEDSGDSDVLRGSCKEVDWGPPLGNEFW